METSSQQVYRRRRLVATLFMAAIISLVAFGVASLAGGGTTQQLEAATFPTEVAQDWAADREARLRAVADQEALDAVVAQTPVVREGGGREPLVALTFDDGPSQYTDEILDILDHYKVSATFFVVGGTHERAGAMLKEIAGRGHVVANHTVNHPGLDGVPARAQAVEIDEQSRAIDLFIGVDPTLFRPPYNLWDMTTVRLLQRRGMLMVLWSVDSHDWTRPGAGSIVNSVLDNAHPGAIVLLHDGGGDRSQTVAALPPMIEGLRARGYELVTVPRLLREDPPDPDPRDGDRPQS